MLDGLYAALQEAGVDVPRSEFDQASRLVSRNLAVEITRAKWGSAEARRRLNMEDPWIRLAADLLKQADDVESLFAAAERYRATHGEGQEELPGSELRDR